MKIALDFQQRERNEETERKHVRVDVECAVRANFAAPTFVFIIQPRRQAVVKHVSFAYIHVRNILVCRSHSCYFKEILNQIHTEEEIC